VEQEPLVRALVAVDTRAATSKPPSRLLVAQRPLAGTMASVGGDTARHVPFGKPAPIRPPPRPSR